MFSGLLTSAVNGKWVCSVTMSISAYLHIQWHHKGSLKWARVGVIPPLKLVSAIYQGFSPQRPGFETFISSALRSPAWAANLDAAETEHPPLPLYLLSSPPAQFWILLSLGASLSLPPWNFLLLQHHPCQLHSTTCSFLETIGLWECPGHSVAEAPCFRCRGAGLIPALGTRIPHATQCRQKNKWIKIKLTPTRKYILPTTTPPVLWCFAHGLFFFREMFFLSLSRFLSCQIWKVSPFPGKFP